jgi:hypothetical protein
MGLGNPSWRSTALIRQMIKICRREQPTNTSRSFESRKFPRAEILLRAKSVVRNRFVLSLQQERLERENRRYPNRPTKSSGSIGNGEPCAVGGQKSDVSDKLLLATPGVGTACGWFGVALSTAATFDVFRRLQVTNYGLFNILFESAPKGSNLIGVWVFCTHGQTAFPNLFRGNVLATSPGESKVKKLFARGRQ